MPTGLVKTYFFRGLKSDGHSSDKEMKFFRYEYKKVANLGKLYLSSKIHEKLCDSPGTLVIFYPDVLSRVRIPINLA